jgi:hypothetical protein
MGTFRETNCTQKCLSESEKIIKKGSINKPLFVTGARERERSQNESMRGGRSRWESGQEIKLARGQDMRWKYVGVRCE